MILKTCFVSYYSSSSYEDRELKIEKLGSMSEEECKNKRDILNNPDYKLAHPVPWKQESYYHMRQPRTFVEISTNTNRFSNTFIPSSLTYFN